MSEALEKHQTRNDWLNAAKKSLQAFEINQTLQEIKSMKLHKFRHLVKIQASKATIEYLLDKQVTGKNVSSFSMKNLYWLTTSCQNVQLL